MANPILKAIDRLIKAGYPEGTAKKIATGELDMSLSARNARMRQQGYDPTVTYHYGPKGIQEFRLPTDNRKYKFGPGVYSSPRPEYGERYLAMRGIEPEDAEAYHLVSRGKMANDKTMESLHGEALERGGNIASRDYWEGMQGALKDRGYTGLDFMGERNVFDPANIRDVNRAAFDPDQVGKPNILGSAAPVAAGGILGALGLPEDATAADIAFAERPELSEQGQQEVQQLILDTLMGFMAPTRLGDATMDAYNRNRNQ